MTKSRGINRPRHKWTPAELEQLRRDYPHNRTTDIAATLGALVEHIYSAANRHGLEKSEAHRWRKPLVPEGAT